MDNMRNADRFNIIIKFVTRITTFNGNREDLLNFIDRVEQLTPSIEGFDVDFKEIILGYILDRVVGDARKTVLMHGRIQTWTELKTVLIRNHGEIKTPNELMDKLVLTRCNGTVEQFFNKIKDTLQRLNNAYLLQDNTPENQIETNKRIALSVLKDNLPEPVRGIIIGRNPGTMHEAYNIIATNGYLNFARTQPKQNSDRYYSRNYRDNQNYRNDNFRQSNNRYQSNGNNYASLQTTFRNDNSNRQIRTNNRQFNNDNRGRQTTQNDNFSRQTRFFNKQSGGNSGNRSGHFSNNFGNRNPGVEPMDISINENRPFNRNDTESVNFPPAARNNYLT